MKYLKVFVVSCLVLGFLLWFSRMTMPYWFPSHGGHKEPVPWIRMLVDIFIPLAMALFIPAGLILGPLIDLTGLHNPIIIMSAQVILTAGMFTLLVYVDDLGRKRKIKS